MLVYCRNPMAYTEIEGRRIYGKYFAYGSFGPTLVPRKLFYKYKIELIEAPITKDWLEKHFNAEFPDVSFICSEMKKLNIKELVQIARGVGIKYIWNSRMKVTQGQRAALNHAIMKRIESAYEST